MRKILALLSTITLTLVLVGSFSSAANATPSDAIPCPAGRYSATGYSSDIENIFCAPAPAGSYVAQPSSTAPTPCPAGTYQENTGAMYCLQTDPGTYAPANSVSPIACPAGRFSSAPAAADCMPARLGYFVPDVGSTTDMPCAPGTYSAFTAQSSCAPAPAGFYVPDSASHTPLACPAGFTTANSGATSVAACSISTAAAPPVVITPVEPNPSIPVVISPAKKAQSIASLKLPKTLKFSKAITFSRKASSALSIKATVAGKCKLTATATAYKLAAQAKSGTCALTISNAGNANFLPLKSVVSIKLTK